MVILASIVFIIVGKLPAAPDWGGQNAYETILGLTPRIVAASIVAYFCGEFLNSFVLAKLKVATQGKWFWLRTVSSTLLGEGVDTVVFVMIAFWGVLPSSLFATIIISNYIFKVGIEILFTPVTYWITSTLKRREQEDYYDRDTNFNPFTLKASQ